MRKISSQSIQRIILEQSKRANVGHIGSALSIVDIIATLYGSILIVDKPDNPQRDRFILSKGHAALALYAAFYLKGWLSEEDLDTYCSNNTLLGVHPERSLRGVDFSTGSLGQGLSMGVGAALAACMKHKLYRTFVLLSDAECNEGSLWEAVMFAAHHRLSNLIAIVDKNEQQALGYTRDVVNLDPLSKRFEAFGWDVQEVDGHNVSQMIEAISKLDTVQGPPHILIAKTIFGKGVSYMENKIKWHYWPMNEEEYKIALDEIDRQE